MNKGPKSFKAMQLDFAKNNKRKSRNYWGGKYTDGQMDGYHPDLLLYSYKRRNSNGRFTYYYKPSIRQTTPSYRKYYNVKFAIRKYKRVRNQENAIDRFGEKYEFK